MNIGSPITASLPVAQLSVASTSFNMMPFELLMPKADGTVSLVEGQAAVAPVGPVAQAVPVMASPADGPIQNTADPREFPELQDKDPGLPAFKPDAEPHAQGPALTIIAWNPLSVNGARPSPSKICKEAETVESEASATSYPVEALVASLSLPIVSLAALKPPQSLGMNEPEISSIVEPGPIRMSLDKPADWTMPFLSAFEIAQPTSITQPIAAAGSTATGHLDLAGDPLWLEQLAREITAVATNDGKIKFSLSPASLGSLEVAISTQADGVSIQLQPSTEVAARILAAEQPKLTEELRQSGIKLVNSDLVGGQQMSGTYDHSQAQQSNRQVQLRGPEKPTVEQTLTPQLTQRPRGRFA